MNFDPEIRNSVLGGELTRRAYFLLTSLTEAFNLNYKQDDEYDGYDEIEDIRYLMDRTQNALYDLVKSADASSSHKPSDGFLSGLCTKAQESTKWALRCHNDIPELIERYEAHLHAFEDRINNSWMHTTWGRELGEGYDLGWQAEPAAVNEAIYNLKNFFDRELQKKIAISIEKHGIFQEVKNEA